MSDERKISPHEFLKHLRNGEKMLCRKCNKGIMEPMGGNHKETSTFICKKCGNQFIIN